jgi:hypothetical protein
MSYSIVYPVNQDFIDYAGKHKISSRIIIAAPVAAAVVLLVMSFYFLRRVRNFVQSRMGKE